MLIIILRHGRTKSGQSASLAATFHFLREAAIEYAADLHPCIGAHGVTVPAALVGHRIGMGGRLQPVAGEQSQRGLHMRVAQRIGGGFKPDIVIRPARVRGGKPKTGPHNSRHPGSNAVA